MKKILFGITSLTLGGAERVLIDLTDKIANEYAITIFTIYDNGELKKEVNPRVSVISLYDKKRDEFTKFERFKISLDLIFKNTIPTGYDTYVAFLEGPITRLFAKKIKRNNKKKNANKNINNEAEYKESKNVKRIAWIHNDISKVFGNTLKSKIKLFFDKRAYKKYDKLIFVSQENQNDFNKIYDYEGKNEEVIRNYLDYKKVIEKSNEPVELPFNERDINLLTVCRLVDQKALDRYINVHSKLEKEGVHSKVYIIGDGNQKYKLQKQIDENGVTDSFYLLGAKENPYPYIKNTNYFCLLSYYEGFPMVIEEAKIFDKKIIITETAAKECVENYKKSLILENTEKGIYEGLKKVLSSNSISNEMNNEDEMQTNRIEQYYDEIIKKIEKIL